MYWLPYSHFSHHPSQTPCLPWISYSPQKLMLDSCKILQKQSEAFHTFLWYFFQFENIILLHIVLLKCPRVQIAFLKFTSCDNQYSKSCCTCSFEPGIINIGKSSHKMYSNNILNLQESTTILNVCTKKSGNLLNASRIIRSALSRFSWGCRIHRLYLLGGKTLQTNVLVWFLCLMANQLFLGYLMPKPFS